MAKKAPPIPTVADLEAAAAREDARGGADPSVPDAPPTFDAERVLAAIDGATESGALQDIVTDLEKSALFAAASDEDRARVGDAIGKMTGLFAAIPKMTSERRRYRILGRCMPTLNGQPMGMLEAGTIVNWPTYIADEARGRGVKFEEVA